MNTVLLTTSIFRDGLPDVLSRMVASIGEQKGSGALGDITLLLLIQNCTDEQFATVPALPDFVVPILHGSIISLSAARNILLRAAFSRGLVEPDALIAFPDDDCWYPSGLLAGIQARFSGAEPLDFFFCSYSTKPLAFAAVAGQTRPAKVRDVVRNASSNTIFLRGSVAIAIGSFDEDLGVGTRNNGGEDIEYALRAFLVSRRTAFLDAEIVGHRDKDRSLRAKYYRGSLLALRRHALADFGIAFEYVRKIAVGGALSLKGEMPASRLLSANIAGHKPLPPSPFR
ncbi:hypothetical protein OSH11_03525 [Kaistia dalseonensis]|uniref:Glycosyltransferase family 2 protein n=1 Tax=Kaistia dalseonensis TaxID=410840 RepID=A0ABU0H4C8_9HYPH|nr:hypothetical protein [Kaistia dalseonensis]MCX5493767.1 hypothetical protein [Kaistia dalseonensis]MDQ0436331.1 hypothetical protein [Kaistia dalseonensis]